MQIIRLLIIILFLFKSFTSVAGNQVPSHEEVPLECNNVVDKKTLINAWYIAMPYQYPVIISNGRTDVSGMDIELINAFAKKSGINIVYKENDWFQDQLYIKEGTADVSCGATYTLERSKYAYFSKPYRSEEISLFIIEPLAKKLNFENINQFMAQVRLLNLRLGIIKGNVYGEPEFTAFLYNEKNQDIISVYQNDMELINGLMRKEIDGFVSDRIVGAVNVLGQKSAHKIIEVPLNIKTPIHLMFSKKSVSLNTVEQFNFAIEDFIKSPEYKKIVKTYIYHILLPKSIDSRWCYIIGLLGSIAFAISGIIVGAKKNTTLFGTFLFAILPSTISCIILDLIVNHDSGHLNLYFTPSYFYYVFVTVLISFTAIKLFSYYNKQIYEDVFLEQIFTHILAICDAFGQAAFIIVGVVLVITKKIEPLGFWGPCFAFLTSNWGVILRNFVSQVHLIKRVPTGISIEISVVWGLCFSVLLDAYGANPDYDTIKYSIAIIIAGAFITNLLVYHYGFPDWRFRNEKIIALEEDKLPEK